MGTINELINELKNIIIVESIYYDKSMINNVSFDTLFIKINKNIEYINEVTSLDLYEEVNRLKEELVKLYEERNKYAEFISKTNGSYDESIVSKSTNSIIELEKAIKEEEQNSKTKYDSIINENIIKIDTIIKELYNLKVKFHITVSESNDYDLNTSRTVIFERNNEEVKVQHER